MSQLRSYQELRLAPGATEREIKAAFRQLAKESHPDSGRDGGDPRKFQKVHEAYQNLLAKARENRESRNAEKPQKGVKYLIKSRIEDGLNVNYELDLAREAGSFTLTLPWVAYEVCPRCFGEGRTLTQLNQGSVYRPTVCPRCGGAGYLERESYVTVEVDEEMAAAGKIRLKGAGSYDVKSGERGDLYVSLNFVERLREIH
jgi:DnaJ-class molecular chaperone